MPTTDSPLWKLSACALRQRFTDGTLTPLDAAQSSLRRMDEVHSKINAVICTRRDAVLKEAQASTARYRAHQPLSPIDGIPITVKDNILTRDMPTTWGSTGLKDYAPDVDEIAVARLRAAGALIVGKTNLPAFALEGYTSNKLFGTTRNPWDLARTPGGSSGGAVASVASGVTPLALGTDGGGSIRRPASHCGLVGFKPSIGSVARDAALPPLLLDFEVIGPLTRTVADAALLFGAIAGPAATDRLSFMAVGAANTQPAGSRRILYVPTLDGAPVDPEVAVNCAEAARGFQSLGYVVDEGTLPLDLGDINAAWPSFGSFGLQRLFATHPEWRSGVATKYLARSEQGGQFSAEYLLGILELVHGLRVASTRLFDSYEFIITPSAAALPWSTELEFPPEIDGKAVGPRGHAIFTGWVNALGVPALAVPVQPSSAGLPIGIQIVGRYGADQSLLELGQRFEAAHPWTDRWPDLHASSNA